MPDDLNDGPSTDIQIERPAALTQQEAAHILGMCPRKLSELRQQQDWRRRNGLPVPNPLPVTRHGRYVRSMLDDWLRKEVELRWSGEPPENSVQTPTTELRRRTRGRPPKYGACAVARSE